MVHCNNLIICKKNNSKISETFQLSGLSVQDIELVIKKSTVAIEPS